jgi:RNA polymerase sigma factor (sigma-70 family)
MIDDAELLRRYASERAQDAFTELVRRHIDFVYAAGLRQVRGNSALAQDVTQKVFIDLARKADTLARHRVLLGWLHTATRYAAAKAVRAETRRAAWEHAAQTAHILNENPSSAADTVDWQRIQPVLDDVLGELAERERAAILLRFFEAKPFAEVGAKLALNESAARSCVNRALEKMRGHLERRGIASTGAALGAAMAGHMSVAAPAGLAASVAAAAVASSAAAGSATMFGALFAMSKIKIGIAGVLLVAALVPAALEVKANRSLRAELGTLRVGGQELGRTENENRRLNASLANLSPRNPDVDELARLRARAAQLAARPDGVTDEEMKPLRNLGRATPEAAMETFLWALTTGDADIMASFIVFSDDTPENRAAFMAQFSEAIRARYRTPEHVVVAGLFPLAGKIKDPPVEFQILSIDGHVGGDGSRSGQLRVRSWARTQSGKESGDSERVQPTPNGWALGSIALTSSSRPNGIVDLVRGRLDPLTGEPRPLNE